MPEDELPPEKQLEIVERELERTGVNIEIFEHELLNCHPDAARLFFAVRDLYKTNEVLNYQLGRLESSSSHAVRKREDDRAREQDERDDQDWSKGPGSIGAARVPDEVVARSAAEREKHKDVDWLRDAPAQATTPAERSRVDDLDWLREDMGQDLLEQRDVQVDRERGR